jgi:hypothetical protein
MIKQTALVTGNLEMFNWIPLSPAPSSFVCLNL